MGPALPEGYAEAVSSLKSYGQTRYFPSVISTDDKWASSTSLTAHLLLAHKV